MSMTTELAQRMKAAAIRAKAATEDYVANRMSMSVCLSECEEFNNLSDGPDNIIALVEALEAAEKRNAELECITGALREIRPGHITIAGEKIGIYMRDEVDAALASSGVAVEGE